MENREQVSLRERWDAYQHLEVLTDHWYWRPGWNAQRRFYTWHITFDGQPVLHNLVTDLQRQLDLPGLDLVPIEGLHLTMQGLGFTDEVDDADVDAILSAARRRCAGLTPFDLTLGPVDADPQGVGLLINPWSAVEGLRTTVREAIGDVWSEVPESADEFRPHVTVAYSGAAVSPAAIRDRMQILRGIAPVTVPIASVALIMLRRDDHVYRWETVDFVRLGPSAGSAAGASGT